VIAAEPPPIRVTCRDHRPWVWLAQQCDSDDWLMGI